MNISQLISIVKKKIEKKIILESITIEDKTFLHKKHKNYKEGKFHLKLIIESSELKKNSKIDSTKIIYKIIDKELNEHIHSIQILIC